MMSTTPSRLDILGSRDFEEAETTVLATGNNDDSVTLDITNATANQIIKNVLVSVPGALGDVAIQFFDGLVATNAPISDTLYIKNQPTGGFTLNKYVLSGILGWRISGLSSGTPTAYLDIKYGC